MSVATAARSQSYGHPGSVGSAGAGYRCGWQQRTNVQNARITTAKKQDGNRETEGGRKKTQRCGTLFDPLQSVPPRALSDRADRGPMEDDPASHARAGKSPGRTVADDPQIPAGQQRTLKSQIRNDPTIPVI